MPEEDKIQQETGAQPDTNTPEDVSAEDNVISSDEMQALESKESDIKGGILGKIFKKSDEPQKETEAKKEETFEPLLATETEIRLIKKELKEISSKLNTVSIDSEKLDGKLESERAQDVGIQERLSHLTEEIGEIRSMVLDRERSFNEIESGYKKIEGLAEDIQPALIKKEFDKKERELIELTVKVEQVEAISQETNRQIKLFREQMDKIKSLDNLLKVAKDIEKEIEKIKDTERYTGRMAAKTEEMFSELDKRIAQFATQSEKVESLDEISKDLMQSVDKNEIKLKEAVFKEDIEKLKKSLTGEVITNLKSEMDKVRKESKELKEALEKNQNRKDLLSLGAMNAQNTPNPAPAKDKYPELEKKLTDLETKISLIESRKSAPKDDESDPRIANMERQIAKIMKAMQYLEENNRSEKELELEAMISTNKKYIEYLAKTIESMNRKNETESTALNRGTEHIYSTLTKEITDLKNLLKAMDEQKTASVKDIEIMRNTLSKDEDILRKIIRDESILNSKIETEHIKENTRTKNEDINHYTNTVKDLESKIKDLENTVSTIKKNKSAQTMPTDLSIDNALPANPKNNPHQEIDLKEEFNNLRCQAKELELEESNSTNPDAPIIYDHDLRLNKLIRMIEKTEWLLAKGKHEEAIATYHNLTEAYEKVSKKVPASQMIEIRPRIEEIKEKI